MDIDKLKQIIEAALMVSEAPLSRKQLLGLFAAEGVDAEALDAALGALAADYDGRGVELVEVASGFRFQARTALADYVNRVFEERPPRYSRALLETLAIIAYRQPVTRGEIEAIRGVAVSTNIIRQLTEREWIRVAGHRDVPGRPAVYATTPAFLDYFNLKSVTDLPALPEIRDIPDVAPDLFGEEDGKTAQAQKADAAETGVAAPETGETDSDGATDPERTTDPMPQSGFDAGAQDGEVDMPARGAGEAGGGPASVQAHPLPHSSALDRVPVADVVAGGSDADVDSARQAPTPEASRNAVDGEAGDGPPGQDLVLARGGER